MKFSDPEKGSETMSSDHQFRGLKRFRYPGLVLAGLSFLGGGENASNVLVGEELGW